MIARRIWPEEEVDNMKLLERLAAAAIHRRIQAMLGCGEGLKERQAMAKALSALNLKETTFV